MKTMNFFYLVIFFAALSSFSFSDPDYDKYKKDIELNDATNIKTKISFKAGELSVMPVSSNYLMQSTFKYNKERWKPDISYEEKNDKGYLEIISTDESWNYNSDNENKTQWKIGLSEKVTHDISIDVSAGEANIDLQDCKINRFYFDIGAGEAHINLRNTSVPHFSFDGGAGEAEIDLSGEWENDLDATIDGGVGEITLILPSDIGIELNITGILGERNVPGFYKDGSHFTNKLNGKTKHNLFLDVSGGIGTVNVRTVH